MSRSRFASDACPHCGADDDGDLTFYEFADDEGSAVAVGCLRCGAHGPVVRGPLIGEVSDDHREAAVRAWNERAA